MGIYLTGVQMEQLRSLIKFMYSGEVQVANGELEQFLDTANLLEIEGLQHDKAKEKKEEAKFQENGMFNVDKMEADIGIMSQDDSTTISDTNDWMSVEEDIVEDNNTNVKLENEDTADDFEEEPVEFVETEDIAMETEKHLEDVSTETENTLEEGAVNENEDEESSVELNVSAEDGDIVSKIQNDLTETDELIKKYQKEEQQVDKSHDRDYCMQSFKLKKSLVSHVKKIHSTGNDFLDESLTKTTSEAEPWNKVDSNTVCSICNKKFSASYSLDEHKKAVHEGIRFPCDFCDHISSSKRNLRGHMRGKHPAEELPVTYRMKKLSEEEIEEYMRSRREVDMSQRRSGRVAVRGVKEEEVQEEQEEVQEEVQEAEVYFLCPHCSHRGTLESDLMEHMVSQHSDRPLPSSFLTEPRRSQVMDHTEVEEEALPQRDSEILSAPSEEEINARIDGMVERREDGLWLCLQCGQTSKVRFVVRRHAETHLEGFSHPCTDCPPGKQAFRTRANLLRHRMRCHKEQ